MWETYDIIASIMLYQAQHIALLTNDLEAFIKPFIDYKRLEQNYMCSWKTEKHKNISIKSYDAIHEKVIIDFLLNKFDPNSVFFCSVKSAQNKNLQSFFNY